MDTVKYFLKKKYGGLGKVKLLESHGRRKNLTLRQAFRIIGMPRSIYSYVATPYLDELVREQLRALIEKHPAIEFWQSYHRIRRLNLLWNH